MKPHRHLLQINKLLWKEIILKTSRKGFAGLQQQNDTVLEEIKVNVVVLYFYYSQDPTGFNIERNGVHEHDDLNLHVLEMKDYVHKQQTENNNVTHVMSTRGLI